jgi:hypothetical protein
MNTHRLALMICAVLAISCSGGGSGGGSSGGDGGGSPTNNCDFLRVFSGTVSMRLTQAADGTFTGTGMATGTETGSAITQSPLCTSTFGTVEFNWNRPATGTSANLSFSEQVVDTPAAGTVTRTIGFAGSLRDGVISGTVMVTDVQDLRFPHPQVASVTGGGSASFPVVLR